VVVPFLPACLPLGASAVFHLVPHPSASAYVPTAAERHEIDLFNTIAIAIFVVFFVLALVQSWWFGITLTTTEARVHNLRRRVIRWDDVRGVTVQSLFGTRTVVLHEDHRRTRLRAPSTGPLAWDRRFEEKYHTIGQWWLTRRWEDEQPQSQGIESPPE
jgi:hypothetical protein